MSTEPAEKSKVAAYPAADGLNSPDLSGNLKPRMRALDDEQQICNFVKRLVEENRQRNVKNARIMSKYNAEKPFAPGALENEGLSWKSNFSSQPLATLIDRIAPRFTRAVNSVRSLTNAKLPDTVQDGIKKTEAFRRGFTELVRNRVGWTELLAEIAMENALFGYTAAGFVDETSWFPRHFRQDEFFVPAITKQNAKFASAIVFRDALMIDQVFELIVDKEEAKLSGWDIENTVLAINKAMPENMASRSSDSTRKYEDLYRESNLYLATAQGSKVVMAYHVFTKEVTGKVSHYIVDGTDWKLLFKRYDRFDSMTHAATFFSFQQAQGNLMASKGVGRTVYMLAGIVDRSRNEIIDRFQLAGKVILQGDEKDIQAFRMSVIGSAVMISSKFKLQAGKIDAGVGEFKELDTFVRSLMDEISGNVSPAGAADNLQGERITNGQVNFIADLQNEGKDIKIERFLTQLSALLTEMQRRASSDDTSDEDAKEFRDNLLRIMTREEFDLLAKQPTSRTVDDLTDHDRQIKITICSDIQNSPLCDQRKVLRHKLVASVNEEFADDVLLPDADPTITAENKRMQQLENIAMKTGEEINVSPRDNHEVHLATLMPEIEKVAGLVAQDAEMALVLREFVDHGKEHVQAFAQSGGQAGKMQPIIEILTKVEAGLQQLAAAAQSQEAPQPEAQTTPV